jgi:hypothetical protein
MAIRSQTLAATTGAIDWDIFEGDNFDVHRVDLVFVSAPSTAGVITVTKDSVHGSAFDAILQEVNPVGLKTVTIDPIPSMLFGDKVNITYSNPDGISVTGVAVTGMCPMSNPLPSIVQPMDLYQAIAEGSIQGYSLMEKFGENPVITTGTDPEDVWDGGGIYTFSTAADIDRLSSSDAADTMDITVYGLDENWEEVVQTITLTGQTPVALTTSLIRVYRMVNAGSVDIAGDVYCFKNGAVTDGVPDVAADIRAIIRNGNNQTLMTVYTVPAGKTGYFWGGYVAISRGVTTANVDFTWRARPFGSVFAVKSRIACVSNGNSTWNYTYKSPVALPEKTDILIRAEEVSQTCGVSGGFTVILRDNTRNTRRSY